MKKISVTITQTYNFVKNRNCESCHLYGYCDYVDGTECEFGTVGGYECEDEYIEQNY